MSLTQKIFYPLLVLIWVPALMLDSTFVNGSHIDSQTLTSTIIIALWAYLLFVVDRTLKIFMIIMVPLSLLGEIICCLWLDMYNYRSGNIPLYVPFGHGVLYATGVMITNIPSFRQKQKPKKTLIALTYILLFVFAIVVFKDSLSVFLAIMFLYVIHRKNYPILYLIMGVLVAYLELLGTQLGTWYWHEKWWIFTTTNPPVGAVFLYITGDILLMKIITLLPGEHEKRLITRFPQV